VKWLSSSEKNLTDFSNFSEELKDGVNAAKKEQKNNAGLEIWNW
jgi:hypothetical protein